jgi:hypothetical protein
MTREALLGVLGAAFGIACGGAQAPANVAEPASTAPSAASAPPPPPSASPSATVAATEVSPAPPPAPPAEKDAIPLAWYLPPGSPAPAKPVASSGLGGIGGIKPGSHLSCGASEQASCGATTSVKPPKFEGHAVMPARPNLPADGTARAERAVATIGARARSCLATAWNMDPDVRSQTVVLELHAAGKGAQAVVVPKKRASLEPLETCIESAVRTRFGGDDAPVTTVMTITLVKKD